MDWHERRVTVVPAASLCFCSLPVSGPTIAFDRGVGTCFLIKHSNSRCVGGCYVGSIYLYICMFASVCVFWVFVLCSFSTDQ